MTIHQSFNSINKEMSGNTSLSIELVIYNYLLNTNLSRLPILMLTLKALMQF